MAKVIENVQGRRLIRLSTEDIFSIVSLYQQRCSLKAYTHDEARKILGKERFYLPEEL